MQHQRTFATSLMIGALMALTGCASLPSPEAMKAETASYQLPKLPQPGKAIVYVVRPSGVGGTHRFNVFVDDRGTPSEMGYTKSAQYIYFQVTPGEHRIYSRAENWSDIQVSAKDGDIIYIQQEPSMGLVIARNDVVKLDDHLGKYHVKNLTLGTIFKAEK